MVSQKSNGGDQLPALVVSAIPEEIRGILATSPVGLNQALRGDIDLSCMDDAIIIGSKSSVRRFEGDLTFRLGQRVLISPEEDYFQVIVQGNVYLNGAELVNSERLQVYGEIIP